MKLESCKLRVESWGKVTSFFLLTFFTFVTFGFLLTSCGYTFGKKGFELPEHLNTIAVPTFQNHSFEPAIENIITRHVRRAFLASSRLELINNAQDADLLIDGTVKSVDLFPLSFDGNRNVVIENRIRIRLDIRLQESDQGQTIWHDPDLETTAEFLVQEDPSATRVARDRAILEASEHFAEDLVHRVFEGSVP